MAKPAPPATAGKASPDGEIFYLTVMCIGIGAIIVLGISLAVFYGTGGETSAAGVLGIVIPAVTAIASAAFGVAIGTKAGAASGQKAADLKKQTAVRARAAYRTLEEHTAQVRSQIQSLGRSSPGSGRFSFRVLSDPGVAAEEVNFAAEDLRQIEHSLGQLDEALGSIAEEAPEPRKR